MKAKTLIYSLTLRSDFNFLVFPSGLSAKSTGQIHKIIMGTTSWFGIKDDELRYLVFSCENKVLFGLVSYLRYLSDNNPNDEKFFEDRFRRRTYAFIGFLLDQDTPYIPQIDKKIVWNIFKKYMDKLWELDPLEIQYTQYEEIDFSAVKTNVKYEPYFSIGDTNYYIADEKTDLDLLYFYLDKALHGENVLFMANITNGNLIDKPEFRSASITTSLDNIEYMKEKWNEIINNTTDNILETDTQRKVI